METPKEVIKELEKIRNQSEQGLPYLLRLRSSI